MNDATTSPIQIDIRVFETTPGLNVLLRPMPSEYPVIAISNDFLHALRLTRGVVVGRNFVSLLEKTSYAVDKDALKASLDQVLRDKEAHEIKREYAKANNGSINPSSFHVRTIPVLGRSGEVAYIICSLTKLKEDVAVESRSSRGTIEDAYQFFMNAPVIIGYLRGQDYVIEFANERLLKVWGRSREVIGQPLFAVFPELETQGTRQLLDQVRQTGKPFFAYGHPLHFDRNGNTETLYFDFIYQAYFESEGNRVAAGVISVGHDVTERVLTKKEAEESQKRWKELANAMPVMVWTADKTGRVDFLNDQWYQFTGSTAEESLGFGWVKVLHPDDVVRCAHIWRQALEDQVLYEIELRYKRKDGEYRWSISRGVPIKVEGEVVAWYGTSTDIHEQKQLELLLEEKVLERTNELEKNNRLLDNILRNSSNGISVSEMIFDDKGNVVDARTILANDAAIRLSGLSADLYLAKRATELDPDILTSAYGQKCVETLRTGEPFLMQYYLELTSRWLEVTVSKMDNSHLIHIFTDVTAVKQAQLDLEKSLEDLRYANTNLEEFAYAASHDLKEPVRKMQFFANRLRTDLDERLDDKQRQLFERLESSGARMSSLIDDLLEYSQAAKGSAQQEDIALDKLLPNVLEDLDLEIHTKDATITFHALPVIRGNKRQIHQLFQNLISNALKYSRPDVPTVISITSSIVNGNDVRAELPGSAREKKFNMIQVSDNGIGFEQRFADRIFNVFTRLHSDPKYRGSGIGLAIVKKVVESHQGYIWAKGRPGEGSVFSILFPLEGSAAMRALP